MDTDKLKAELAHWASSINELFFDDLRSIGTQYRRLLEVAQAIDKKSPATLALKKAENNELDETLEGNIDAFGRLLGVINEQVPILLK